MNEILKKDVTFGARLPGFTLAGDTSTVKPQASYIISLSHSFLLSDVGSIGAHLMGRWMKWISTVSTGPASGAGRVLGGDWL